MQIPLTELEAFERRPVEAPEPPLVTGPIVVAVDGGAASDSAVRVASSLSARTNAGVRVVSVLEPFRRASRSRRSFRLVPTTGPVYGTRTSKR